MRAMNIIYDMLKERGSTILISTTMVEAMNPASALVLAGLAPRKEEAPTPLNGAIPNRSAMLADVRESVRS